MTPEGLVTIASAFGFAETLQRLIDALAHKGVPIFATIDHAENARLAGLTLHPTTVIVFGAARAGTPLMQANPLSALDLPLRALVTEDASGAVSVAYNQPAWIAARHGLRASDQPTIAVMTALIEAVIAEAVGG